MLRDAVACSTAAHFLPTQMRRRVLRRRIWVLRETSRNPQSSYSVADLDRHRCIFFHIPKTAGVAVSQALFGSLAAGHLDVATAKAVFGPISFQRYFKFCFVRNPWDRLVSAYHYLQDGGMERQVSPWTAQYLAPHDDFQSFVLRGLQTDPVLEERHFRPQYQYVSDSSARVRVDFVGRFENLNRDFELVAGRLGIEATLPQLNVSARGDYHGYYDEETARIVADVYERDITLFGYDF